MMSLKSRVDKLFSKVDVTKTPFERALLRYSEEDRNRERSFDQLMLLDTIKALCIKDAADHPDCEFAKRFLAWASTTGFRLIERAERIMAEMVDKEELPAPWEATAIEPGTVQPPYPCYCTQEQLAMCPKHPLWGNSRVKAFPARTGAT